MNQLDLFQTNAIRTESRIDEVVVNERLLTSTIQGIISLGNILDMLKKNVFYGKEINFGMVSYHFQIAIDTLNSASTMSQTDMEQKNTLLVNPRLFHAVVGTVTEGVELLEALDLYKAELDNTNIAEEFGDINWYQAIAFDEMGVDWQTVLDAIITKLRERYPDKFTSDDAINRNLDAEREILEKITK